MEIKRSLFMSALAGLTLLGGSLVSNTASACGLCGVHNPLQVKTAVDRPMIVDRGKSSKVIIKIEVEGSGGKRLERMPLNLAIVLDRSGSMSGAKLEQAKQAAMMLVDQLDRDDVLSVVLYDTEVNVAVSAGKLGDRRREIKRIIERIQTGGSTALYAGVEQGGRELREYLSKNRINRVMLLSDGIANVGPSSNREIASLGSKLSRDGASVTTIGLGNDYNETLMTALAEASDANYYYVADVEGLPSVFEKELGELQSIVARDIEIEINCPEGVRPIRFLGRPGELSSQSEKIAFGTVSNEQVRELYLECEIDANAVGDLTEIAAVSVAFTGSSAERESLSPATVVVGYTKDEAIAEKVLNREVSAEATLFANALETERAIALADSGNIVASREQLATQKVKLQAAYAAAPAEQKAELSDELASVEEAEQNLSSDGFSKDQRKKLSNKAWMLRNSKR